MQFIITAVKDDSLRLSETHNRSMSRNLMFYKDRSPEVHDDTFSKVVFVTSEQDAKEIAEKFSYNNPGYSVYISSVIGMKSTQFPRNLRLTSYKMSADGLLPE